MACKFSNTVNSFENIARALCVEGQTPEMEDFLAHVMVETNRAMQKHLPTCKDCQEADALLQTELDRRIGTHRIAKRVSPAASGPMFFHRHTGTLTPRVA